MKNYDQPIEALDFDEHAPEIRNPTGSFPCLIVCDHASSRTPADYNKLGLSSDAMEKHIAIDIGIADIVRDLSSRLNAPAVLAPYSRLLVDCNRWIDDPRCIVAESDAIVVPGNIDLGSQEKHKRFERYFWPYHRAVHEAVVRLRAENQTPLLLSLHSCTRQLGSELRNWDAGTIWHENRLMSDALIERLCAGNDLLVGDNQPYSGIGGSFTIDYHSWGTDVAACGLEVVNDQLREPDARALWVTRLAHALEDIARNRHTLFAASTTQHGRSTAHPEQTIKKSPYEGGLL